MGKRGKKERRKKPGKPRKTPPVQTPQALPPQPGTEDKWRLRGWRAWQAFWRGAGCSWTALVAVGVIIGVVAGIDAFWPKVTIVPDAPLRPRDMLSTPFHVTNSGRITLYDVWATCQVDTLTTSMGQLVKNARPIERMIDPALTPGEPITFGCHAPNFTGNIIGSVGRQEVVRLSIEVRYRPWGIPWTRIHTEGFRAVPGDGELLRWIRVEAIPVWRPDFSH